ncbi:MAG: carbamoyl phosphate synthase large subunit, partial [Actinomycetota bacterium]
AELRISPDSDMAGKTLAELDFTEEVVPKSFNVKAPVFPFIKFPGTDTLLGPEMRSTGEVMGIDTSFGKAFFKAELSAGTELPTTPDNGLVFLSLADPDKPAGLVVAQRCRALGLGIAATSGTAAYLAKFGFEVDEIVAKVQNTGEVVDTAEGRSTAPELIEQGKIAFVVNTPRGRGARSDGQTIRKAASMHRVSCVTTVDAALAAAQGLGEQSGALEVRSLQEYHAAGADAS